MSRSRLEGDDIHYRLAKEAEGTAAGVRVHDRTKVRNGTVRVTRGICSPAYAGLMSGLGAAAAGGNGVGGGTASSEA